MKEGISGKSKEEVWGRFCYIASCAKAKVECEETTPADFDYRKFEQKKWVYSYKYRGPPCEFLELGTASCHEFLHSPKGLASRPTDNKVRKAQQLGRKHHREKKARKTREALTQAAATRQQVSTHALGRSQSIQNLMQIRVKQSTQKFDQLFKLYSITTDEDLKVQLQKKMSSIAMSQDVTYRDVEKDMYGPVVNLVDDDDSEDDDGEAAVNLCGDSGSDDDSDDDGDDSVVDDDDGGGGEVDGGMVNAAHIVEDVMARSGFVVLQNILGKMPGADWFTQLLEDLETLRGTTYYEVIINGAKGTNKNRGQVTLDKTGIKDRDKTPSTTAALGRVADKLKPYFHLMKLQLEALHLVKPPRNTGPAKILHSRVPCPAQQPHHDFDPKRVQTLIKEHMLHGVPLSALCAFTPTGSKLLVYNPMDQVMKEISFKFGQMVLFTGDVVHAGAQYDQANVRGFLHVTHEELCPYNPDEVFLHYKESAQQLPDVVGTPVPAPQIPEAVATPIPTAVAVTTPSPTAKTTSTKKRKKKRLGIAPGLVRTRVRQSDRLAKKKKRL